MKKNVGQMHRSKKIEDSKIAKTVANNAKQPFRSNQGGSQALLKKNTSQIRKRTAPKKAKPARSDVSFEPSNESGESVVRRTPRRSNAISPRLARADNGAQRKSTRERKEPNKYEDESREVWIKRLQPGGRGKAVRQIDVQSVLADTFDSDEDVAQHDEVSIAWPAAKSRVPASQSMSRLRKASPSDQPAPDQPAPKRGRPPNKLKSTSSNLGTGPQQHEAPSKEALKEAAKKATIENQSEALRKNPVKGSRQQKASTATQRSKMKVSSASPSKVDSPGKKRQTLASQRKSVDSSPNKKHRSNQQSPDATQTERERTLISQVASSPKHTAQQSRRDVDHNLPGHQPAVNSPLRKPRPSTQLEQQPRKSPAIPNGCSAAPSEKEQLPAQTEEEGYAPHVQELRRAEEKSVPIQMPARTLCQPDSGRDAIMEDASARSMRNSAGAELAPPESEAGLPTPACLSTPSEAELSRADGLAEAHMGRPGALAAVPEAAPVSQNAASGGHVLAPLAPSEPPTEAQTGPSQTRNTDAEAMWSGSLPQGLEAQHYQTMVAGAALHPDPVDNAMPMEVDWMGQENFEQPFQLQAAGFAEDVHGPEVVGADEPSSSLLQRSDSNDSTCSQVSLLLAKLENDYHPVPGDVSDAFTRKQLLLDTQCRSQILSAIQHCRKQNTMLLEIERRKDAAYHMHEKRMSAIAQAREKSRAQFEAIKSKNEARLEEIRQRRAQQEAQRAAIEEEDREFMGVLAEREQRLRELKRRRDLELLLRNNPRELRQNLGLGNTDPEALMAAMRSANGRAEGAAHLGFLPGLTHTAIEPMYQDSLARSSELHQRLASLGRYPALPGGEQHVSQPEAQPGPAAWLGQPTMFAPGLQPQTSPTPAGPAQPAGRSSSQPTSPRQRAGRGARSPSSAVKSHSRRIASPGRGARAPSQQRSGSRPTATHPSPVMRLMEPGRVLGSPRVILTPQRQAALQTQTNGDALMLAGAQPSNTPGRRSPMAPMDFRATAGFPPLDKSAADGNSMLAAAVATPPRNVSIPPQYTDTQLPALWTHSNAFKAHTQVVKEYMLRRKQAMHFNGKQGIKGRALAGYTSRCGIMLDGTASKVTVGCGTALADVHYHCSYCKEAEADPEPTDKAADVDMDDNSHHSDPDCSLDYCTACVKEAGWKCPNPNCLSKLTSTKSSLEPRDFLQDNKGVRQFARESENGGRDDNGEAIAHLQARSLDNDLATLPEEFHHKNSGSSPMYVVDVYTNDNHQVYKNGLAKGVPVLIKGCADFFDNEPFSAESMRDLARTSTQDQLQVKDQYCGADGGTIASQSCSLDNFFRPMLKKTKFSELPQDHREDGQHVGYKLPDFGLQPEAQTRAFWDGLTKMGLGDICRGDSEHNIANSLRSEQQDHENGTQVPDLGPKFYIARPLVCRKRNDRSQPTYSGHSFTPLHCDLADAVNYACWGSSATWHIFHRDDRPKLLQFLGEHHGIHPGPDGNQRTGEEMLWNASNHTLLQPKDFDILRRDYKVKPWVFTQDAGDIVVIPAGCAHQVKNDGGAHRNEGPNIKIAQDFIAPQSALVCLELMSEMRMARQEDKLQAVLSLRFAGQDAFKARDLGAKILERPCPLT